MPVSILGMNWIRGASKVLYRRCFADNARDAVANQDDEQGALWYAYKTKPLNALPLCKKMATELDTAMDAAVRIGFNA